MHCGETPYSLQKERPGERVWSGAEQSYHQVLALAVSVLCPCLVLSANTDPLGTGLDLPL